MNTRRPNSKTVRAQARAGLSPLSLLLPYQTRWVDDTAKFKIGVQTGGQAIRREGWSYWLLYRGFLWLISSTDPATQIETRRVATALDFRDSEFLAKDWTDELFTGASYPPCTTPGPAGALAESTSGARGAWTLVAGQCAGGGNGGSAPPVSSGHPAPPITGDLTCYSDNLVTPIDHDSTSPVPFCAKISWSLPVGSPGTNVNCWYRGDGFDVTSLPVSATTVAGGNVFGSVFLADVGWSGYFRAPGTGLWPGGPLVVYARLVLADIPNDTVLAHYDMSYRLWISGS